jgi:hypothetical protein
MVRPPRFAQGNGEPPFGGSGAPGLPQPLTQRAIDLARQDADDNRGRFTERIFVFPEFGSIAAGSTAPSQSIKIVSNRTSFVRMVAMRGGITNGPIGPGPGPGAGFPLQQIMANTLLRLQINGQEDASTNGDGSIPMNFDALFSPVAPWFWWAAPPRMRVSDTVQATIAINAFAEAFVQPYLELRMVDDEWWQELYGT